MTDAMTDAMNKICRIDDMPNGDAKKVLIAALKHFAKEIHKTSKNDIPFEQFENSVLHLWECGYLKVSAGSKKRLCIEMCFPEEAPQLNSVLAKQFG